jgi:hypothetical protein
VISAVGATGFGEQKNLIDASIAAGVSRFIPSEFSSDALNDVVLRLLPLFAQKKEVIEYLRSKESDSFTWTGIATSGLFDWVGVTIPLARAFSLTDDRALPTASWATTSQLELQPSGIQATTSSQLPTKSSWETP